MILYKITNMINNKIYIGATTKTLKDRWYCHIDESKNINNRAYNLPLKKDIRKYGINNFFIEELAYTESENELWELEQKYIVRFKSFMPENGYNVTLGGKGGLKGIFKPVVVIDPMTEKVIEELPSIKGTIFKYGHGGARCCTKRLSRSKNLLFMFKNDYIKKSPNEIKETIIKNFDIVCQLSLEGVLIKKWFNMAEAGRSINKTRTAIMACCSGRSNTCGGFGWCYFKDLETRENKYIKLNNDIRINQFDLQGNFIQQWGSIKEASKKLHIDSSCIVKVCKGKRKQTGNFIWRYIDEIC